MAIAVRARVPAWNLSHDFSTHHRGVAVLNLGKRHITSLSVFERWRQFHTGVCYKYYAAVANHSGACRRWGGRRRERISTP